ncbi:PaaI family thioesterase [Bradyrhizobium sp.]|uniref:PaaI family thioesterase n=1 Tax=Bradyrhizobium sp. TaxID=376 RepID=UPI001D31EA35|nr:PaaI family thioesterase [Bradyrhizobium sp.]MBI5323091.1 PaaI family thioesterase [Bradyrhizobium sp.]
MSGADRIKQLAGIMELPGFSKSVGMRVVSAESGKLTMALVKRPDLTQFFGHFHGGVIAGLADHAAGACATLSMPEGKIAVSVEIKINFLAPADGEEIIARAEIIQGGSTISVVKVEVSSRKAGAERICAFATATMRAMDLPAGFR